MKTPAHHTLIKMEWKAMADAGRVAYEDHGKIADDEYEALGVRLEQADDAEAAQMKRDWRQARPHLFKAIVTIDPDELEPAFGASPSLKAQGEIVQRHGQASAEAAARSWGTALGSLKPGRNPSAEKSTAKKAPPNGDAPEVSKNPWHDGWRAPRPPKDAADRERMRIEAQDYVIVKFGSKEAINHARVAGKSLSGQPLRK
jgi:hypothetical protein